MSAEARLLRMLEEIRADAKAGFANKNASWRRRGEEPWRAVADASGEHHEQDTTRLSSEAEAQLVGALESELLSDETAPAENKDDAPDPTTDNVPTAINHGTNSEQGLTDLDHEFLRVLKLELRQESGP